MLRFRLIRCLDTIRCKNSICVSTLGNVFKDRTHVLKSCGMLASYIKPMLQLSYNLLLSILTLKSARPCASGVVPKLMLVRGGAETCGLVCSWRFERYEGRAPPECFHADREPHHGPLVARSAQGHWHKACQEFAGCVATVLASHNAQKATAWATWDRPEVGVGLYLVGMLRSPSAAQCLATLRKRQGQKLYLTAGAGASSLRPEAQHL